MSETVNLDEVPIIAIHTADDLELLSAAIGRAQRIAVDTETHNAIVLDNGMWAALRIVSVGIRTVTGTLEAYVVDVRDVPPAALAPVLGSIKEADAWNANFDDTILEIAGCNVQAWRDAMHVDGLLHCGITGFDFWHPLSFAAKKYLGIELAGKGTTQTSYDGTSDLTDEQIRYPGFDALVTLLIAEELDRRVDAQGLRVPVENEVAARPFLQSMTEHGLAFENDRWKSEELGEHVQGKNDALRELADLTGGAEVTLFGESENPSWNPDSDTELRKALNTYAAAAVKEFTGGRLLERTDKLDKTSLKQIKHPLAKAVLKYRNHSKVLSTYGDNLDQFIASDGRMHPQYKQGGVVATGRLSSDKPNAQNFSPQMKRFFRAAAELLDDGTLAPRAYVYADLSQAELRVLAQVSGDEGMRALFRLGGDFHARTAADMFKVDMDSLKDSDPTAHTNHRKKAKGVNFGIPYGLGAAALATNLTVNSGLPTSTEEAAEALKAYAAAYPAVDRWLSERDKYVRSIAEDCSGVDWDLSLELFELHSAAAPVKKSLRRKLGRPASTQEISEVVLPDSELRSRVTAELEHEPSDADIAYAREVHTAKMAWALGFDAPVVLLTGGTPWSFESRSMTGRRRLFTVPMNSSPTMKGKFEGVITSAMLLICTSDKQGVADLRKEFADENGMALPVGINRCQRRSGEDVKAFRARSREFAKNERVACVKAFEGDKKPLKYALLKFVEARMGKRAVHEFLLPMAFNDQVRALGNRFRNHPIQSLVADVGLEYYAELLRILPEYRNAFPVQAVHDSIAIECDLADAPALRLAVKAALEGALSHWCPDVPAVADADIRLSFDDDDVVEPDDVPALLEKLTGAVPVAV